MGIVIKEFYIGRYIYLTEALATLPDVRFSSAGEVDILTIYSTDPVTGEKKRRRLTKSNKDWDSLSAIADRRIHLEKQLKLLKQNWKKDHGGSLSAVASGYTTVKNTTNTYSSDFWDNLVEGRCPVPNDYPVRYKGYNLRSQFELEVAKVLDSMGLDYKYEVGIRIGGSYNLYPDMSVNLPEYNRCGFVEAMGGLSNLKNIQRDSDKIMKYIDAGLLPNRDMAIISGDKEYRPDSEIIRQIIGVMLSALAVQYVFKKS